MENKTKIYGIGISGLIGSRISELLKDNYIFDNLSLDTGVNITDPASLDVIRNDTEHPIVLHLAAKADVDGCEQDKAQGEEGPAYKINVLGTKNVVEACKVSGKKMIYVSTDFVFDGENTPAGGYTEEDQPHPLNWYAETKYQGEKLVQASGVPYVIVRLAYPFQAKEFALKKDFVHAILGRLKEGKSVAGVTDHIFTPTYIDDIARSLGKLLDAKATGIYHTVGSQSLTPYDAAVMIAEKFGFDTSLIGKTTREEYFKGKARRPFNLTLNNAKIEKLGIDMRTFQEGLQSVV